MARYNFTDLSGHKFGRFTAIRYVTNPSRGWLCRCDCGEARIVPSHSLTRGLIKSCGCLKRELMAAETGPLHRNWKGGLDSHGYRRFSRNGVETLEHRDVVEKHLKRSLHGDENVRHINGDRTDNRLENLELWSTSQPCGRRVADKLAWAKEIIARYDKAA